VDVLTLFTQLRPDQVALGAIVTFMVLSLIRGWVVPRSVLVDRISDKDGQILALKEERETWRRAYHQAEASRLELTHQNGELIESASATNKLIEALRQNLEPPSQNSLGG
jgi:hypothetical protein